MIGIYTSNALVSVTSSTTAQPVSVVSNTGAGNIYAYLLPNTASGSITITANQTSSAKMWLTVTEYANVAASPIDAGASGSNTSYANNVSNKLHHNSRMICCGRSAIQMEVSQLFTLCLVPVTEVAASPLGAPDYLPITFVQDVTSGAAGSYTGECVGVDSAIANILGRRVAESGSARGSNAHFQPGGRKLRDDADGNPQHHDAVVNHLLHHRRHDPDDQLDGLHSADHCCRIRDSASDCRIQRLCQ